MKNGESITLFMVCDNHLVIMMAVLLKSIEIYHKGKEEIEIYIINDNISKTNVAKINKTIHSDKIRIHWRNLENVIPKNIQLPLDKTILPKCIYARLFASHFLPNTVKKAIYLDVDMIILRDINKLWNLNINNHIIAAVTDNMKVVSSPWGAIKNYKELGLSADTKYFNAGLLIIDLVKWRKMDVANLVIKAIRDNINYVTFTDQYGLNLVFINNWFELDPKWNSYSLNDEPDPYLIHFIGIKPIFKGYRFNLEYKNVFYNLLKLTPWLYFKPQDNYIMKLKKIKSMVVNGSWRALIFKLLKKMNLKYTY